MQEMRVLSLGWEDPLEEEMATHSSILACRIPWAGEPGGLQSMGSQRVGHDRATEHTRTRSGTRAHTTARGPRQVPPWTRKLPAWSPPWFALASCTTCRGICSVARWYSWQQELPHCLCTAGIGTKVGSSPDSAGMPTIWDFLSHPPSTRGLYPSQFRTNGSDFLFPHSHAGASSTR